MNTPLIIFNEILPQEVLNQIQQYLPVNENIRLALSNYYDKLYDKKVIDDEEVFEKYVYPKCVCANCPDNGRNKIYKRKDCDVCFEYETKEHNCNYSSEEYHLVIENNPQYRKVKYGEYDNDNSINDDDMWWYDDRDIWLE